MSFEEKMEKAKKSKEKREADQQNPQNPNLPAKRHQTTTLTKGHRNVLYARLIEDVWMEGGYNDDAYELITKYYKDILKSDPPAKGTMWTIATESKNMWLTAQTLPNLENYRKMQISKAEKLEREIDRNSRKDITDKAKSLIEVYKYQDKMVGIDDTIGGIDVAIQINTPQDKVISALEVIDVESEEVPKGISKD